MWGHQTIAQPLETAALRQHIFRKNVPKRKKRVRESAACVQSDLRAGAETRPHAGFFLCYHEGRFPERRFFVLQTWPGYPILLQRRESIIPWGVMRQKLWVRPLLFGTDVLEEPSSLSHAPSLKLLWDFAGEAGSGRRDRISDPTSGREGGNTRTSTGTSKAGGAAPSAKNVGSATSNSQSGWLFNFHTST